MSCESTEKLNRFYRFSKPCQPFCQNGTERNDINYGKKTTVLRPYYGTEFETLFCLLLYCVCVCVCVCVCGLLTFLTHFYFYRFCESHKYFRCRPQSSVSKDVRSSRWWVSTAPFPADIIWYVCLECVYV